MTTTQDDLHRRFHEAVQKRTELQALKDRKTGALEQARSRLATLKKKCVAKNIDPDNIEALLDNLRRAYREKVEGFEEELAEVEGKLSQFTEDKT